MIVGIIVAVFLLFFARLTYRRLHARRCDQYLIPLVKIQNELADPDKKDINNTHVAEPSVPIITIDKIYNALRDLVVVVVTTAPTKQEGEKEKEQQQSSSQSETTTSSNKKSSSSSSTTKRMLVDLPEVSRVLATCPTVAVSLAGQRVVWTRSPTFMRRVLLTHFRMFPGPASRQLASAQQMSSYTKEQDTAAFLSVILNRQQQQEEQQDKKVEHNTSSSSSFSPFASAPPPSLDDILHLSDGEQTWDQATWLGGYKPGEMPDIPGLLLRGMCMRRQHEKNRGADISAAGGSGTKTLSSLQIEKFICAKVAKSVLLDMAGDSVFSEFEHNDEFSDIPSSDSDDALLVSQQQQQQQKKSETTKSTTASSNSKDDNITTLVGEWCSNILPLLRAGGSASSHKNNNHNSASWYQDMLMCATFMMGLSPYSFVVSKILSSQKTQPLEKERRSVFDNILKAGIRACVERHADLLADDDNKVSIKNFSDFHDNNNDDYGNDNNSKKSLCGINVLLMNCGCALSSSRGANDKMMNKKIPKNIPRPLRSEAADSRWDSLLRKTVSGKSAVVAAHLMVKIIETCHGVLAHIFPSGTGNSRRRENILEEVRQQQQQNAASGNYFNQQNNDDHHHALLLLLLPLKKHLEGYAREALRFNPAVSRCVRVSEGDDPQPGQTFGIANEKVVAICGSEAAKKLLASSKTKNSSSSSSSTNASEKSKLLQEQTTKDVAASLDPSMRLSNNGYLSTPSSACVVCDVAEMMQCPEVWGRSHGGGGTAAAADPLGGGSEFDPNRWNPAAAESKRRQELEANFAPFGFGAAAEMATRYVVAVVSEVVAEVLLTME